MKMLTPLGLVTVLVMPLSAGAQATVDAAAAQALMKKSDCFKCHAADKEKKGPALQKIAAKYKGKPEGEDKITKMMTASPKVKLDDGSEEEHKAIKSTDAAAIKNVAQWILSQ